MSAQTGGMCMAKDPSEMSGIVEAVPVEISETATKPSPPRARVSERLALVLPDGREVELDRELSIGQSGSNDVVIRDPSVSRRHCRVVPQDGRIEVVDSG